MNHSTETLIQTVFDLHEIFDLPLVPTAQELA